MLQNLKIILSENGINTRQSKLIESGKIQYKGYSYLQMLKLWLKTHIYWRMLLTGRE